MLEILSTNLSLFIQPKKSLETLQKYSSKKLLIYGLLISSSAMFAYYLGIILRKELRIEMVILYLFSYYIGNFLFLSIVLMGLFMFHKNLKVLKFLGVYLITDTPLLLTLPLSTIAIAFPGVSVFCGFMIYILFLFMYLLKFLAFRVTFHVTIFQTIVLFIFPTILLIFWLIVNIINFLTYYIGFF